MNKVIGFCRNCKYRLTAIALEDKTEQPEFKQSFSQNIFSLLPPAQTEFLVTFLQNQGNISVTAKELLLTEQETIACLRKLLAVLGLELHEIPVQEDKIPSNPQPQDEPESESQVKPSATDLEEETEFAEESVEDTSKPSDPEQSEEFLFPLDKPIDAEFLQQFLHYPDGDEPEEEEAEAKNEDTLEQKFEEISQHSFHHESIQPAVFETIHKKDLQQPNHTEPIQQPSPQKSVQPATFQSITPQDWQQMTQTPQNHPSIQQPIPQNPVQPAMFQQIPPQNWQPMAQTPQNLPPIQQPTPQKSVQPAAFQQISSQNWQPVEPQQPIIQTSASQEPIPQEISAQDSPSNSLNEKTLEEMMQNPLSEEDLQQVMQQSVSEELLQEVMSSEEDIPKIIPSILKNQTITQPTHGNPYLTHSLKMQPITPTQPTHETVIHSTPTVEVESHTKSQPISVSLKASEQIKQKLESCGGTAEILSMTKKTYQVSANQDGKSFSCDKLSFEFNYEVFDIIVDLLHKNGGKADKGTAKGVKFGDPKCDESTVIGVIAKKYFGAKKGDTVHDPVAVLASILQWADIAENCRGYIKLP